MKLSVVPARAALAWVKLGVKTFFRQPLALSGLFFMFLAAMSLANGSAAAWVGIWSLYCICGSLAGPTVWLAVLSGCFVKGRNLAMGIALCGTSVAAAFAPASARLLIDAFDWRVAFQVLAVLWLLPPLVLTVLVFRDRRPRGTHSGSGAAHADAAAAPRETAPPALSATSSSVKNDSTCINESRSEPLRPSEGTCISKTPSVMRSMRPLRKVPSFIVTVSAGQAIVARSRQSNVLMKTMTTVGT